MTPDKSQIELLERLLKIADGLVENRKSNISGDSIRFLQEEVERERVRLLEGEGIVGYECMCLVECIAALAYARTDGDVNAESRAVTYINSFTVFLRTDLYRIGKVVTA